MLRNARASLAGRQRKSFNWLLIAAVILSTVASLAPSLVQPTPVSAVDRMIKLPFASGATWNVSQGYNTGATGGSHYNCTATPCYWKYKYSFDLVRADGNTAGQPVLSPVNGTIRWIDESYGGMSIDLGNGWAVAYFHTTLKSGLAAGQSIVQGQYLGVVAPPGQAGNGGFPHIHLTLWQTTDGGNWSRIAMPFTGTQSLDGFDFPALADSEVNQYRGRTVTSSNVQVGAGETIPVRVTKLSPAHGSTISSSTVALSWIPISNATSYQVVIDPGSTAEQFSPWVTGTSWTTPPLAATTHTWKVRARNSAGTGEWSSYWRFYVVTEFTQSELDNGAMIGTGTYRVYGTRQGMVGGTTSSGHKIVENDHFVSLPACVATTCAWLLDDLTEWQADPTYGYVTRCGSKCFVIVRNPKTNVCRVEPVLDRGPWFNVDNYWDIPSRRFVNGKIEDKGLTYYLAQGYPADAAAFSGYDVGWGTTYLNGVKRGNTNLKNASGQNYPVSFQTSIDIGDGTWLELGFPWDPGPQTVEVTMLWQVGTTVADAEAACEGPKDPLPYFTMSKSSGVPGAVITVNGKHYGANEPINVYFDSSKTIPLATTVSDADGRFSTSFTVPNAIGGPHRVHIVGKESKLRTAKTFKVRPLATPSKSSGSARLSITINGTNFGAGEVVDVFWDGSTTIAGTGTADAAGKVSIPVRAPSVNGAHTAKAVGRTNLLPAYATYKVIQRVRLSPTSGPAGTTVTASGSGWPANVLVSFRWNSKTGTVLCSATTNSSGSVSCTFRVPTGFPEATYRVWGTNGTLYASNYFNLMGGGGAEVPTETPTGTATPEATPTDGTPVAIETPLATETPAATPEPIVPTETATPVPTEVPAARSVESVAVADTSVTLASPDNPQPAESVGSLFAGGPDTAVTYISFNVGDVGGGTVTDAYLVITGTAGGGPGGTVGAIAGYLVDESGTYNSLPTQNLNAAVTKSGAASALGPFGAGEVVWLDVTGTVRADGQYTFVIIGDPAQVLELSSREGASPPRLVLTIQD